MKPTLVRRSDTSRRKLMRRFNLLVVVWAMILVGSWARAAQAGPLYEVATFSTTEQFYDDASPFIPAEPLGRYTDSNSLQGLPYVQYSSGTASRQPEGWPIATTVLQSVVIQAEPAPPNAKAISLRDGINPYAPTFYQASFYSGPATAGTAFYSNPAPHRPVTVATHHHHHHRRPRTYT
jgi:hypothetical protein